jgi:predicted Zn finger-like uncharacterized protein
MPLQTACSSCSAKIKVKDELVGKAIKCPKCGKIFKVAPEGDEEKVALKAGAADAAKPSAKKPPPAAWDDADDEDADDADDADDKESPWDAKSKSKNGKKAPAKKKSDDDEDDDEEPRDENAEFAELLALTSLPDATKKQIKSELKLREKGIWIGQPDPKIMMVRAIPKVVGGLFAMLVLCIILGAGGIMGLELRNVFIYLALGLLYCIAAVVVAAVVIFMDRRKAMHTAYVITNKRCIVYTGRWFFSPSIESFYPDLLAHMRRLASWVFGGDAGDLVFRSVTTITTTHHRRGGTSTSVSTVYYGFLGIREIDRIETLIRQTLLTDNDDDDEDEEDEKPKKKKKKKKPADDDDDD